MGEGDLHGSGKNRKTQDVKEEDNSPNKRNQNQNKKWKQQIHRFNGKCDDLKGHIYDVSDPRTAADTFTKTTREIEEYIGRTYHTPGDIVSAVERLAIPTIPRPADPVAGASRTDTRIWEEEVKQYVKRQDTLRSNVQSLYSLVWGQCTEGLREKIKSHNDYQTTSQARNGINLLIIIRNIMYLSQNDRNMEHGIHEVMRRFYLFSQGTMDCQSYLEKFRNIVEVIESHGGTIGLHGGSMRAIMVEEGVIDPDNPTRAEYNQARVAAREKYFAVALILGSDRNRYGKMIEDLENDYIQGNDRYPKTINAAYRLLLN